MKTPTPKIFIILTAALLAGSGPAFSQTTSTLYNSGGNIGIGTTTPQMALTVTSGTVGIGTWSPTVAGDTMLDVFKSDSAVANDPGNSQIRATAKGGANPRFTSIGYDTALNVGYIQAAEKGVAWRDLLLEANGGNVGIGTTGPGATLSIGDGTSIIHNISTAAGGSTIFNDGSIDNDFVIESNNNSTLVKVDAGDDVISFGAGPNGRIFAGFGGFSDHAFTSKATLTNSTAYVGVVPGSVANTSGTGDIYSLLVSGANLNPTGASTLGTSIYVGAPSESGAGSFTNMASVYIAGAPTGGTSGNGALIVASGNVGIGTTSPGYKLDVFGTASVRVGTDQRARFTSESSTVSFAGVNDAANAFVTLKLEGNPLVLNSQSGGNVGIGTTLPRATLEVANFVGLQLEYNIGSQGGAFTITSTNGNKQKVTLTGSTSHAVTWTAPSSGLTANFIIKVVQGSGSDTLTWPATVKWAGGSAPTLTTTNGATDILGFYFDGTNFWGAAILLNGS